MRAIVVVLALCVLGGGCGAERLHGAQYRDGEASYRIGPLDGQWQRLALRNQNDLAFHSDALGALIQVNATCDPDGDVPLTALTNHLLIGFTEREIHEQRILPMDRREALRTHASARLDGVERELVFYVMKKDECVYDFALIATPGDAFTVANDAFERFVMGFSTESE